MAEFRVYKYEFEKSEDRDLFRKETGEEVNVEFIRKKWGEMLNGILDLQKDKKGEMIPIGAHVLAHHGDIALLAVHNVKTVKQWEEMAEEPNLLESNPHCYAIIDNRQGVQQLLIEKNEAFGKSATPARMIEHFITSKLTNELSYSVKLFFKVLEGEIWDLVESNRKAGFEVTQVIFKLRNGKQMDEAGGKNFAKVMKELNALQRKFKDLTPGITLDADAKGITSLLREDYMELVHLAANNGYDLEVRFKGAPPYVRKNGQLKPTIAMFTLNEDYIRDFETKNLSLWGDYDLVKWLDSIRASNVYKDVQLKSKPRK